MIFEGDSGVIDAIKEKKRLIEAGETHEHIKPVLVIDGGLMKGAYGVGAVLAMEELGYTKVFDSLVGVSSGAPAAAYFVSGEAGRGASVLWSVCCSRKFLNMWRFWNQVNTDYFMSALRPGSDGSLDTSKILQSNTELYIGVANFKTGEPKLLKPKTEEEFYTAIHASILMPNVTKDSVHFDDIRYADGGFTKPHVLQLVLDDIKATHYLVITNQNHLGQFVPALPKLERFLNHTLFRLRMPKALRFAAHERWRERMKVVEKIRGDLKMPVALVWGDRSIKSMERDSNKVKQVVENSRLWWHDLFKKR